MRTLKALPLALVLVAASGTAARAQGFFTPFYGYNYGGDASNCASLTNCQDKRSDIGVSFGSMGKLFGFEQDIAYSKNFFGEVPDADNAVFTLTSNMLVGVGVGPVQPYALIGFGLIRPRTSLSVAGAVGDFSKNALGYDLGGGVTGYFSRHLGVRGDLRHFQTMQEVPILSTVAANTFNNERLSFWRASIGLAIR